MYTLIIVDDEPEILGGLCAVVPWQDLGFSLRAAFPDGESALKWLQEHDADVLLTDVVMGVVSGLDLAAWMHKNRPQSRVVLVSAFDEFAYARQAIEFRVFRYLLKPTRVNELTETFLALKKELDGSRGRAEPTLPLSIVQKICLYIEENLSSALTLSEVSAIFHYNSSYLSRMFKAERGEGFSEYVNRVKIERASRLLLETNLKIYQIAEAVGFRDVRYFTRLFSQLTGKTPSEYRKKGLM